MAIGKRFEDVGLGVIFTESGIVGSGSVSVMLEGRSHTMLYHDRLETIENSQSTNSAKTQKIFNVYSSLGL